MESEAFLKSMNMISVVISGVRFQYLALRFSFGSVVRKTAVSVSVSVLFFVLFCFQLSAYNEWLLMF